MYRDLDAAELAARLGAADEPYLLDVRDPEEFRAWSIAGAVNVPLAELARRIDELPSDRELVSICASGNRSATAAELLSRAGFSVANLSGGMAAWAMVYDAVTLDVGGVHVVQVRRRGKGCLSYLAGTGDEAVALDPSLDTAVYLRLAAGHGWRITRVFETHLHADHLSGARALSRVTGATLHLNPADPFERAFVPLAHGDRFELPGGPVIQALHTPGHTRSSTVYVVDDRAVLSGDTIFVDGVGRPDLADRATEFAHDLYRSLHDELAGLSDETLVLPGHYGESVAVSPGRAVAVTFGQLRQSLDVLAYDEDRFVAWATSRCSSRPPHYAEIVAANMGRTRLALDLLRRLELGPNRCAVSGG